MFTLKSNMSFQGHRCERAIQPLRDFCSIRIGCGGSILAHIARSDQLSIQHHPYFPAYAGYGIMIHSPGFFTKCLSAG